MSLDLIDELRKRGVRWAKIGAGEVYEVEFFGAELTIPVSDGAIDAATGGGRESDGTEGYMQALSQIQRKSFKKQGEA